MKKTAPPSRETCLQLARYNCEVLKDEKRMWEWLMCWVAYDVWTEDW